RTTGGTGAVAPPGESRLGADGDQESVVGPAAPAQPAAHLEQTLADRAGATGTRGVAPGCNSEHGAGGLRRAASGPRGADPPPGSRARPALGGRSPSAAPPDHSWSRPLHGHPPDPRARGDPALPERQAPRQLRGPDPPPPRGPRPRPPASRSPPRPLARLVPGRPTTQGHEDRPRGPGPTLGGDRLSDLEARPGLRPASPRWRAGVSPVRLVFGPST